MLKITTLSLMINYTAVACYT